MEPGWNKGSQISFWGLYYPAVIQHGWKTPHDICRCWKAGRFRGKKTFPE